MDNQQEPQFCINCIHCDFQQTMTKQDISKCNAPANMARDLITGSLVQIEGRKYCYNVRRFVMRGSEQCKWFESKQQQGNEDNNG